MNLFVSNLSEKTNETQLLELFSQFGEVCKIQLVRSYQPGTVQKYAFVEMLHYEDGKAALQALNNFVVMGLNLDVKEIKRPSDQ